MAVHVGIDEPWVKQPAARINDLKIAGFDGSRSGNSFDGIAADQDVGLAVDEPAAADQRVGHSSSLPADPIERSARPERIMYQNRNTPGRAMSVVSR